MTPNDIKKFHKERELTQEETIQILSLQESDIKGSLFIKLFGRGSNGEEPKFHTNDYFKLPTNRFNTKKEVWTTVGIYIFNLFIIQPHFAELFGYINKPVTADVLDEIEGKMSKALYDSKIDSEYMADYYNRIQWLGGNRPMSIISPTLTPDILEESKEIISKRNELFKENKDKLDPNKNPESGIVGAKIEQDLVKISKEYLKNTEGYENFESGAKISIGNHYKNMNVMKGTITSSYDGKNYVNISNFNSGIKKDEYTSLADSAVAGSYARAVNTGKSGYLAKEMNQALQAVELLPENSNCGTKKTLPVFLYPNNKTEYLDRYIVDGKKGLVLLTQDNWKEYENKWVNMRSVMYCKAPYPYHCSVCAGLSQYKLGITKYGAVISRIGNVMLNVSMKAFHNSTKGLNTVRLDDVFDFGNS